MQLNSWLHRQHSVAIYSAWVLHRFSNVTYVATSNLSLSFDTNKVFDRDNYEKNAVEQDSESAGVDFSGKLELIIGLIIAFCNLLFGNERLIRGI